MLGRERAVGEVAQAPLDGEAAGVDQRLELGGEELPLAEVDDPLGAAPDGAVVEPDQRDLRDRVVLVVGRVLDELAGRRVAEAGPRPAPARVALPMTDYMTAIFAAYGAVMALLLVLCVLAAAGIGFGVRTFMAGEERVKRYCHDATVGETVEEASRRARERNLAVTAKAGGVYKVRVEINGVERFEEHENKPSLDVRDVQAMSFCNLYHDGQRITGVSYNAWYE